MKKSISILFIMLFVVSSSLFATDGDQGEIERRTVCDTHEVTIQISTGILGFTIPWTTTVTHCY